ncbi:hypothetical protein AWJ20_4110 [Sugiyamaella lignohabitans]|uniref:Origin recognition complex subunit 4 C-terminal domain-containing protein n=1 Tax=Sugiyamaella lignohabitans TaxID=796027 RepID=A0A167C782_9ASCO|nr:uncharacterized protein AWJ20_4110 [Sugiyamaella lignohabitans]ANB11306.1 hypothetical protein AWJ20_4110 [Sugiyamaella lignohabitans]
MYAIRKASPFPAYADFTVYLEEQRIADSQSFVESLSELELALLICAARAEVKLESDTLNFNLVYDEYVEVGKRIREDRRAAIVSADVDGYRIWSRQVARSAWEKLEAMELVVYISSTATGKAAAAGAALDDELKLIKVDASLLEISNMIGRSHPLHKWTRI